MGPIEVDREGERVVGTVMSLAAGCVRIQPYAEGVASFRTCPWVEWDRRLASGGALGGGAASAAPRA